MRIITPLLLTPLPAAAHVGHLGELAGHDHWVAGAVLGAAVLGGLLAGLRGRGARGEAPRKDEAEDGSEAEA